MKQTEQKPLSYFQLKLEVYLDEHHPELLNDKAFIKARADEALTVYCASTKNGSNHLEAEFLASETLYKGLHFSKYDTLVTILEEEFSEELPEPLPQRLAHILVRNEAINAVFDKYKIDDDFAASEQYDTLYTELTGTIVLLIEANNLPTISRNNNTD